MSKFKLFFISLVMVIGVLAGCSSETSNDQSNPSKEQTEASENATSESQEKVVTISITKNKGEKSITEMEIPIEDGAILYDVMKENFEIEDNAGYITSIEGIEAKESEQMAWMFFVNGEMGSVGAKELELSPGDSVNFDLQPWE